MEEATKTGFMTATDLADYLVLHNVAFRDAHGIVGRAVAACIEKGCELTDLSLEEMREFSPSINEDIFKVLSVEGSVNSRISTGGTASVRVEEAVQTAEKNMGIGE
jgi:argininosuccinate lyase